MVLVRDNMSRGISLEEMHLAYQFVDDRRKDQLRTFQALECTSILRRSEKDSRLDKSQSRRFHMAQDRANTNTMTNLVERTRVSQYLEERDRKETRSSYQAQETTKLQSQSDQVLLLVGSKRQSSRLAQDPDNTITLSTSEGMDQE